LTDMLRALWTSITGGKKMRGGVAINFHRGACRGRKAQAGHRQKLSLEADRGSVQACWAGAQEGKCSHHGGATL